MGLRIEGKFATLGVRPETRDRLASLADADNLAMYEEVEKLIRDEILRRGGSQALLVGRPRGNGVEDMLWRMPKPEPVEAIVERKLLQFSGFIAGLVGAKLPEKQVGRDLDVIIREQWNEYKARAESERLPGFEVSR